LFSVGAGEKIFAKNEEDLFLCKDGYGVKDKA
jgi:hypothetical protein